MEKGKRSEVEGMVESGRVKEGERASSVNSF